VDVRQEQEGEQNQDKDQVNQGDEGDNNEKDQCNQGDKDDNDRD
jgi:hypothetical protein